jgi:hypothetical protein
VIKTNYKDGAKVTEQNELVKERNEVMRRITEELTPKIDGIVGCSVQEIEEATAERVSLSNRIAQIDNELKGSEQAEQSLPDTTTVDAFETDGLLEQIADLRLFEAIEPEPTDGERLHEYDERRKEHNLIIYFLIQEKLEAQDKHYQGIIKTKDDDYLDLLGRHQKQVIYQTGLEEDIETLKTDYQNEILRAENLKQAVLTNDLNVERLQESIETLEYENEQMSETIAKLESQIESSKRTETVASTDLQERVANLKAKSKSADEFMKQYYERNNMTMPEVEAPELEVTEEEIFPTPTSEDTSLPPTEQGIEQQDSGNNEPAVREIEQEAVAETFEERTERRLNALELKVNRNNIIINHELEVA